MIGRRIGSWILERELGHGGMGSVYEARHATLLTHAAIKVLSPGLESEESFRQRFHREAELQAQLRHPNVARVLDYLEDDGRWFLVLEFIDGGSIADYLSREGRVSREQAIAWTRQALAGLSHAHQKGIVHRDVKPANLLIGGNGEVVVMDFGIARSDAAPGLTATGATVGTPHYMSPEQILTPDRVDRRSDVYSLGIVLYELLSGRKPFDAGSQFAVLQAQVNEPPPPLRTIDPAFPPELEAIVMRALAKSPDARYPDAESMSRELERVSARHASMPAEIQRSEAGGATIHSSHLFDLAQMPGGSQLSPGEARSRRRRAFQRKLAAGAAATLVVATMAAMHLASDEGTASPKSETVTESVAPRVESPSPKKNPEPPAPREREAPIDRAAILPSNEGNTSQFQNRPPMDTRKPEEPENLAPPVRPPTDPSPPAPVPLPQQPRVAVVGMGKEPLLTGSLEQEMERRLVGQFEVGDEHGDPEVSSLLSKDHPPSHQELGAALLKGGFHVLVLVRVAEGDRQKVSRFGVETSAIGARMHLNAYLLPAGRSIGTGWTQTVEYTEASAAAKAKQAFIGPTADLRKAIHDDWAALRSSSVGGAP